MSNADQWLVLAVRNVSSVSDLAACRVGASLLRVPSAENAHARESNVVNVPDAPIFSPHFIDFRLFHLMVWYDLTAVFDMATKTNLSSDIQLYVERTARQKSSLICTMKILDPAIRNCSVTKWKHL